MKAVEKNNRIHGPTTKSSVNYYLSGNLTKQGI